RCRGARGRRPAGDAGQADHRDPALDRRPVSVDAAVRGPGMTDRMEDAGTVELSDAQFERYARHLILDEVGEKGQEKLLGSRVLVVGAGGLGAPLLLYLAAAGVGTLGVIDDDVVELSNLQRQVIHTTDRVGALKVDSAAAMIEQINPDVRVERHAER